MTMTSAYLSMEKIFNTGHYRAVKQNEMEDATRKHNQAVCGSGPKFHFQSFGAANLQSGPALRPA